MIEKAYICSAELNTGVGRFTEDVLKEGNLDKDLTIIRFNKKTGWLEESADGKTKKVAKGIKFLGSGFFFLSLRKYLPKSKLSFVENQNLSFLDTGGVLYVHDIFYSLTPRHLYDWIKGLLLYRSLKKYAQILVNSEYTKKTLIERFPVDENKVKVFPLAINREVFTQQETSNDSIYEKFPFLKKQDYVFHVSSGEPRKNIEGIIEAFYHQQEESFLVLAGPYPKGRLKKFKTLVQQFDLTEKVFFLGAFSKYDLAKFYRSAKYCIFPSFEEGFGLPALEAQSCGSPVITAQGNSLEEISGPLSVCVNPHKVEDIIDGMKKITEVIRNKKTLLEANEKWIAKYTWKPLAEHIRKYMRINE